MACEESLAIFLGENIVEACASILDFGNLGNFQACSRIARSADTPVPAWAAVYP